MRKITLFGDCEKQDLAVVLALMVQQLEGNSCTLVTDQRKRYNGLTEISTIELFKRDSSHVVFDCYDTVFDDEGLFIYVTDGSRRANASLRGMNIDPKTDLVVFLDSGSKNSLIDASSFLSGYESTTLPSSETRRMEMLSTGLLANKLIEKEYDDFLVDVLLNRMNLSTSDARSLVKVVRGKLA